jgi:hypothetical protein
MEDENDEIDILEPPPIPMIDLVTEPEEEDRFEEGDEP